MCFPSLLLIVLPLSQSRRPHSPQPPPTPPFSAPLLPTRPPIIGVKQLRNGNIAPPTDGYKCQHTLSLRLTHPWGRALLQVCVCYANRLPPSHIFCANQIREGCWGGGVLRHNNAHRAHWWHPRLSSPASRQLS